MGGQNNYCLQFLFTDQPLIHPLLRSAAFFEALQPCSLSHCSLGGRGAFRHEWKGMCAKTENKFKMSTTSVQVLREALAGPAILEMPCCFDALSAKLVEQAGFQVTFMSGFAVSASKLCQCLPLTRNRKKAACIVCWVDESRRVCLTVVGTEPPCRWVGCAPLSRNGSLLISSFFSSLPLDADCRHARHSAHHVHRDG